jgi:hypothetical protein
VTAVLRIPLGALRRGSQPGRALVARGYIVIENFGLASSTGLGLDYVEEACRKRLNLAASVERASAHLSVVLPALFEVQINLVGDFRTEALAQTAHLSQSRFHTVSPKPLVRQSSSTRCASKERHFDCCPKLRTSRLSRLTSASSPHRHL